MGLLNLEIFFDNPQKTYYCGQNVSGRLVVVTDTPKNLRSIIIKLKGEAKVHWSETHTEESNGKSDTRTDYYNGQETYFENRMMVFGTGNDTETLLPGEYSYPFSMVLPNTLPSSFETEYGYIRYTVKVTLHRPSKFDHEAKTAFTVLSHVDLNLDSRNREPAKLENCKTFCCCCCKSGPLTLVSIIPARGFVPGQRVPITVEVDNASNVKLHGVVIELQKYVSLHSMYPRNTKQYHVTVFTHVLGGPVAQNDSKTWAEYLTIPPLPASQLRECSIIDLEYIIKVKAKPLGFHNDLINRLQINIGTIPLIEFQPMSTVPMAGFGPTSDPSAPLPSPSAPLPDADAASSSYPNMPPPSYEECTFGTNSIGDDEDGQYVFGITSYNPRYPTYNLPDPPPSYPGLGWAALPPPGDPPPPKK